MIGKAVRIDERLERASQSEPARVERLLQGGQEEPTKEPRRDAHREEEARATGDPPRPIG